MSIFRSIDEILESFTNDIGANLTKSRESYPSLLQSFEERRISWVENDINKALLIQPTFEISGVNSNLWNFVLVAWIRVKGRRKGFENYLIEKSNFNVIEIKVEKEIQIRKIRIKPKF